MILFVACIGFSLLLVAPHTLATDYPSVTLPWGTWQATSYDSEGDFYVFPNVRFGKAPTGSLRFMKSVFPDALTDPTVVQPNEGSPCFQCQPSQCNSSDVDEPPQIPGPRLPSKPDAPPSEDCLFADLYVPSSALNQGRKVPVVVWIYGGGFIFGAKDAGLGENMPFYDPTGLLRTARAAKRDFIFVTGNYRMGAFGWLAGPNMINHATPNAGLWDQRLLLNFTYLYIPLFGGDDSSISVWGESAGAGSIVHHLTASEPPVFKTALMQSPAYLWQWDPTDNGYAAQVFQNLTELTGCPSNGPAAISCLQNIDIKILNRANKIIILQELSGTGMIPFNPAVDGSLVPNLPAVSLQNGHYWSNISSLLVSHVYDESGSFVPKYIKDNGTFDRFLNDFMPGPRYVDQRAAIQCHYQDIEDARQRAHDVIQDSSFTCNTRFVFDAFNKESAVYMMQYDFLETFKSAVHAADLIPTFFRDDINRAAFFDYMRTLDPGIGDLTIDALFHVESGLSYEYQPYLASFGATGTPLRRRGSWTPSWNPASLGDDGDALSSVMMVSWDDGKWFTDFDAGTTDHQNTETICQFWRNMSLWLEKAAAPSGQSLLVQGVDAKFEL